MAGSLPSVRWILAAITCFVLILPLSGQNLAPNPGFETYSVCPDTYGNGGPLECEPWQNGNQATSDFFHTCAVGTDVGVPDNIQGSQLAHTGNGYTGFYTRESSIWREYVQAPLLSPCIAGITYHVSFYVSLADNFCATANIGAYFSATPPDPANNIGTLNAMPQVEAHLGFINDNQDWVLITGCFVAQGGEQWITIGNFYNNANTPIEPGCNTSFASYYYLDDVTVEAGEPGEELVLELEDDFTTCAASYTIDPGVSGVDYHWSTGETTPEITVNQTDVYILTITSGCASAIDSVEIIFESPAQVQLGPPELSLCAGETFNASFDPSLGEYTWQDGSHNHVYTILSPGVYQVTLENACGISSDEIEITFNDMPSGFSLGEDTEICTGETISFSFDPALGDFLWQDGNTSNQYTITSPGSYSLTISNGCGSVSDQIMVEASAGPTVDLGPATINFCEEEVINISYSFDQNAGDFEWHDGSTEATYVINEPGTYSVTVTNECGSTQDAIIVTTSQPPAIFTLGEDAVICTGEEISFSFDPALGEFEWQDNTTDPNYTIEEGGIFFLTISNPCGSISDTIIITEISAPVVDLGDAIALCEGESVTLQVDPSGGEILWQDGSTQQTYTISSAGLYNVTVSNACGTSSDDVIVTVTPLPSLDLGSDLSVCEDQLPLTLFPVHVTNANSFLWQDNSTEPSLTIASAGVYALTVSNSCFFVHDSIVVTSGGGNFSLSLGNDKTLCQGEILELQPGLSGNFFWQDGSTSSMYTVNAPGMYAVTVSNECGSASDTIFIDYTPGLPSSLLGEDVTLCPGDQVIVYADVPGVDYLWSDLSQADSMIVTEPGLYYLTISNACDTVVDSILVAQSAEPPYVTLPDSMILCEGSIIEISAAFANGSFVWSNGSTDNTIHVSAPGLYSVTVNNSCGTATDEVTVIELTLPQMNILPEQLSLCPGDRFIVNAVISSGFDLLWYDGSQSDSFAITSPGLVTVMISNQCGQFTDSLMVLGIPEIPSWDLGPDTSLCSGQSMSLEIPLQDVNIIWSDGSVGNSYLAMHEELVYATVSNGCMTASDSLVVHVIPALEFSGLGPDQSFCPGDSIRLSVDIQDVNYLWSDGSDQASLWVSEPGTIVLAISNSCQALFDTVYIGVNINGPEIDLGRDILACEGDTIKLSPGVLGVNYLWSDGSTSPTMIIANDGQYFVDISNACGSDQDTILAKFINPPASVDLGADTIICKGQSMYLMSPVDTGLIRWQDGSSQPYMIVDSAGLYSLLVANMCGEVYDEILISYRPNNLQLNLEDSYSWCAGDVVEVDVEQSFISEYLWSNGENGPLVYLDAPGEYSVNISGECFDTTVIIRVIPDAGCNGDPYIPNVFTPNGDNTNDFFSIQYPQFAQVSSLTCRIFDRWGNQVYQSEASDFVWNGTFNGKAMPPGVYVYAIQLETVQNGKPIYKSYAGDVTLMR